MSLGCLTVNHYVQRCLSFLLDFKTCLHTCKITLNSALIYFLAPMLLPFYSASSPMWGHHPSISLFFFSFFYQNLTYKVHIRCLKWSTNLSAKTKLNFNTVTSHLNSEKLEREPCILYSSSIGMGGRIIEALLAIYNIGLSSSHNAIKIDKN